LTLGRLQIVCMVGSIFRVGIEMSCEVCD